MALSIAAQDLPSNAQARSEVHALLLQMSMTATVTQCTKANMAIYANCDVIVYICRRPRGR